MTNNNKKGCLVGTIAIALVLILAVGALGFLTSGFKNWDTNTWLDFDDETEAQIAYDGDGKVITNGGSYAMPGSMVYTSAFTASAVTLTATITPHNATNQQVDWSVSWRNPNNTWAVGKSVGSYVTATPTYDGSLSATVRCNDAFGEQIQITVTSRYNPSITAVCNVGYASRIEAFTASLNVENNGSMTETTQLDAYTCVNGDNFISADDYRFDYATSIGTVSDNYTFEYYFRTSQDIIDELNEYGYFGSYNSMELGTEIYIDVDNIASNFIDNQYAAADFFNYFEDYLDLFAESSSAIYELVVYASGSYSYEEFIIPIYQNADFFEVAVAGLFFSGGSLVF